MAGYFPARELSIFGKVLFGICISTTHSLLIIAETYNRKGLFIGATVYYYFSFYRTAFYPPRKGERIEITFTRNAYSVDDGG